MSQKYDIKMISQWQRRMFYNTLTRKFRKWFMYGLKAQKLIEAARPEGAEALSPGQRPGYNDNRQGAL